MPTYRTTLSPAARATLALGTLSALSLTPQSAFAGPPITTIVSFNSSQAGAPSAGINPYGGVTLDSSGNLYGTTTGGGANSIGVVYEIAKGTNTVTDLASFSGPSGGGIYGGVTLDSNGNLFGAANYYGGHGAGTVYEIAKGSNTINALASFDGTNGSSPYGDVTLDSGGNLFGTANQGGGANSAGTVYDIAKGSNTITDLASFNGVNGNGPHSGVTLDSSGNIFGTTRGGGVSGGYGVVYEITHGSTAITDLASFNNTNGYAPVGGVILDSNGNLFGTTQYGGSNGDGVVYEIAHGSNTITDLASFNGTDGLDPFSGVTLDSKGNLFGTTYGGGANGDGVVYEIAHGSNTITDLGSFNGADGKTPQAGVILDSRGDLFGTTHNGGAHSYGTVFEIAGAAAPVPEASSALSFGLLMLGAGGLSLCARRRRGAASAQATVEAE